MHTAEQHVTWPVRRRRQTQADRTLERVDDGILAWMWKKASAAAAVSELGRALEKLQENVALVLNARPSLIRRANRPIKCERAFCRWFRRT